MRTAAVERALSAVRTIRASGATAAACAAAALAAAVNKVRPTPVHVVPQTENREVVWIGWNTQDPGVMEAIARGVTMNLLGVQGPGSVVVYLPPRPRRRTYFPSTTVAETTRLTASEAALSGVRAISFRRRSSSVKRDRLVLKKAIASWAPMRWLIL